MPQVLYVLLIRLLIADIEYVVEKLTHIRNNIDNFFLPVVT